MPHLLFSSLPSFPAKHTQHIREENVKEQFGGIYIDEATNQLRIEAPPNAATFVDGVDVVAELNNLKSITATSQVSVNVLNTKKRTNRLPPYTITSGNV